MGLQRRRILDNLSKMQIITKESQQGCEEPMSEDKNLKISQLKIVKKKRGRHTDPLTDLEVSLTNNVQKFFGHPLWICKCCGNPLIATTNGLICEKCETDPGITVKINTDSNDVKR